MDNYGEEKIELIKKSFEFKKEKKYKEAIEMLYKVLEFENEAEDNIEILCQLGDLYALIHAYDRAIDEFQKALSIDKNNIDAKQKCFEIYLETNKFTKALNLAYEMCEEHKTAKCYYNYIKALIASKKEQDAIEIFNNLDETIKLDTDLLYLISTIKEDKKRDLLEHIIQIDQTHTNANVDLATLEFNSGNYDKVVPYCLNLVEDHPLALYYLGRIESSKQNYSSAIDYYTKAIELSKDKYDFFNDLAKTYIDIGWLEEALFAIKKSMNFSISKKDQKKIDEDLFLAGWVLIKLNKPNQALLNLNSIEKTSVLYENAQILKQLINLKDSNASKVIISLEKLSKKQKENPILIDTLALAYKELKLYKKAIKEYEIGLKINPNSIYYNLELIDLLIDDKNYDKAINIIQTFKENYQNCPSIYNSLARIYYRLDNKKEALENIDKYIELDKNKAESYYFKGLILNDLSNFEDAKNSIYTAIKLKPDMAKYYSQMARSYTGLKEYENALLYAKEAIEIDQFEINYKKQAYDIAILLNDKNQISTYKKQLERSEKILKLNR